MKISALALVVLVAGCGTGPSSSPPSNRAPSPGTAPTGSTPAKPSSVEELRELCRPGSHRLDGGLLHVPPDPPGPKPLLVVAHGDAQTGPMLAKGMSVDDLADQHGLTVLFPTAREQSWNVPVDGADQSIRVIRQISELVRAGCVAARRITLSGFSSGAVMVAGMVCHTPTSYAAVATVSGFYSPPCDSGPLNVLAFHGTADQSIPYRRSGLSRWGRYWSAESRCGRSRSTTKGLVTRKRWGGCLGGRTVTLVSMRGVGHGWPGEPVLAPDGASPKIDASREVVALATHATSREAFR